MPRTSHVKLTECGLPFKWEFKGTEYSRNGYVPVLLSNGSMHRVTDCPDCLRIWKRKHGYGESDMVTPSETTANPDVSNMSRTELQSLYSTRFSGIETEAGYDGSQRTTIRQKLTNAQLSECLLANRPAHELYPEIVAGWLGGAVVTAPEAIATVDIDALKQAVIEELRGELDERIAQAVANQSPGSVEVIHPDQSTVLIERVHAMFTTVLNWVMIGRPVMMVGPTGSGKTTLARQIATALKRIVYVQPMGVGVDEIALKGYMNSSGNYVPGAIREPFERGGVFLADEMDASDPTALISVNEIANCNPGDTVLFPDGPVAKHRDFVFLAAANTYGRGADRQYVGRNQLDAATLNRFVTVLIDYDEILERDIALAYGPFDWFVKRVQSIRRYVMETHLQEIVSPRVTIGGVSALAAGKLTLAEIEDGLIFASMNPENKTRIMAACPRPDEVSARVMSRPDEAR